MVGSACAFGRQCATGACSADNHPGTCGVCLEVRKEGQGCGGALQTCSRSSACVNGVCRTKKVSEGHACNFGPKGGDSGECDDALYCTGMLGQGVGKCTAYVPRGGLCVSGRCGMQDTCEDGIASPAPWGSSTSPVTDAIALPACTARADRVRGSAGRGLCCSTPGADLRRQARRGRLRFRHHLRATGRQLGVALRAAAPVGGTVRLLALRRRALLLRARLQRDDAAGLPPAATGRRVVPGRLLVARGLRPGPRVPRRPMRVRVPLNGHGSPKKLPSFLSTDSFGGASFFGAAHSTNSSRSGRAS